LPVVGGLLPAAFERQAEVVVLGLGVLIELGPLVELFAAVDPALLPEIELEQFVGVREVRLVDVDVAGAGDYLFVELLRLVEEALLLVHESYFGVVLHGASKKRRELEN